MALNSSLDAAGYLKRERFDVIFLSLDIQPSGIDLARQIRLAGFNRLTPIIMMSGDQDLGALTRGFDAGANFFLYKPMDKKKVLRVLQAAQGASEHERRRFRRMPLQSKVQLKFEKGEIECETIDVSLGGMQVSTPFTFLAGSAARFSLQLSAGMRPIIASGLVTRAVDGHRMGIHFRGITNPDIARLQEFLLPLIRDDVREQRVS